MSEVRKEGVKWRWVWFSIGWMILLSVLSQIPGRTMPQWRVLTYDKLVHTVFYIPLGWALMSAMPRRTQYRFGIMMMIVMAFGGIDEIHQHWVPGRMMDSWDWAADITGGIVSGLAFLILERFQLRRVSI